MKSNMPIHFYILVFDSIGKEVINSCCVYVLIKEALFLAQAFPKRDPLIGDISKAILNITGGDDMIRIEKEWIGDQNNCQNVGTVTGSGSLTFAKMWELFVLTGVASTISLLLASIIYLYKKKQTSNTNHEVIY